ncbi:MAG: hypothetical protein J6C66_06115 [Prevotella sp.]|nr:hypothetical protein [Prevotella sp.]
MENYLQHYDLNFSKRACEYAVQMMYKKNEKTGQVEKLKPWTKEQVEELLQKQNVKLERNVHYNHVFVLNDGRARLYKSSVADEKQLAQYVKDVIDAVDDAPGNIFRRWLVSMEGNGLPVDWEAMI